MNNLINLIKMQYYSVYAIRKTIATILVIALMLSIFDADMIVFSASMIIMSLTYSSAAYEDRSNMNHLIYSLPIQPKLFVLSKYVYGFLNTIIAMVISNIGIIIMKALNLFKDAQISMLDVNLALIFIGALITVVVIPISLIAGFEKGRLFLLAVAIIPVFLANLLGPSVDISNISISPTMGLILGSLIFVTITLASYFITSNLYEKKDI